MEQEGQDGTNRGLRRPHSDRREDTMQDFGPLVDVAGGEQLRGRGPLEIDARERRSAGGGLQVHTGRLGAASRCLKRLRQLGPGRPRLVGVARARLEGQPIEASRLLERQLARGLSRCAFGELGAALARPAPEQMNRERLEVDARGGLERPCEPPVMGAQVAGREELDDGLPDAVVTRLDDLVALAEPDPDEAFAAKQLDVVVQHAVLTPHGREDRERERPSGDRHHLCEAASSVGQALEPIAHHLREGYERERRVGRRRSHTIAAYELLDEKGAAVRFARGGARRSLGHLVGCANQRQREPLGIFERERTDADVADVGAHGPALVHLEQEGACGGLLLAVRQEQQDGRRVRGTHHLLEQRDAVHVAPLHVVDVEDERSASCEGAHELTQSDEGLLPDAVSVLHRCVGKGCQARDALDDGKQPCER